MTLGVFLAIGESLTDFRNKGHLSRLINYNIHAYSKAFEKVYIFSYKNEKGFPLPKNCHLVPAAPKLHRYLYALLLPILKRHKILECDVFRGLQITGGIPALIAKILFGKKYLINYGYDYPKFAIMEDKPIQSALFKLIESPIIKFADDVIVTSSEIRKKLIRKYQLKKIHLIPNGVDLKLFRKMKFKKNLSLKVVYIGRLERQKNLESLIRAISALKNTKATFYGAGSLKGKLEALGRELSVNLQINKPVTYKIVPKVLNETDIFVLPSLEEGNPKVLLEAMACQTCVIGSNVQGIKEIITDKYNGILTGVDSASISKALKKLSNVKLRERLAKNAREFVTKFYDINILLSKEIDLLKKMAAENE